MRSGCVAVYGLDTSTPERQQALVGPDQLVLRHHDLHVLARSCSAAFHAQYGEHWAQITIEEGHLLAGSLPPRALRMVRGWRRSHENELRENWARVQRPEPPTPVQPLL